jgi:hypothetical protein
MFIEDNLGKEMILRIVRKFDNGNILGITGEKPQDFEKKWKMWLLSNFE